MEHVVLREERGDGAVQTRERHGGVGLVDPAVIREDVADVRVRHPLGHPMLGGRIFDNQQRIPNGTVPRDESDGPMISLDENAAHLRGGALRLHEAELASDACCDRLGLVRREASHRKATRVEHDCVEKVREVVRHLDHLFAVALHVGVILRQGGVLSGRGKEV